VCDVTHLHRFTSVLSQTVRLCIVNLCGCFFLLAFYVWYHITSYIRAHLVVTSYEFNNQQQHTPSTDDPKQLTNKDIPHWCDALWYDTHTSTCTYIYIYIYIYDIQRLHIINVFEICNVFHTCPMSTHVCLFVTIMYDVIIIIITNSLVA